MKIEIYRTYILAPTVLIKLLENLQKVVGSDLRFSFERSYIGLLGRHVPCRC